MSAPDEHGREINQVHRQASSVTRLAAVALLVGIAVIGCAKHDGAATPAGSTPLVQASQVDQTTPAPTPAASDTAAPTDSASPSPSSDAGAPATTPDPLVNEINTLNNLINGINSSLSGGDAGTSGGE